ncbi:hypothetical protein A176_000119 [Myxococcus hansupus]|uniref:DUF4384 domain-containing protein n=1 Tax=Pseudomyxococcus hansupus TaxID=1297742 RepID=A0A0H4X5Q7_9BACT|nr:hypothetical protein [Myxococcus hansupus]AKQ63207.1 hypothetical protein A176_000119 [Myxococcus hansupus]
MSGHLSRLVLDELVVGDAAPPAHLAACAECQAKLARLREAAGAARVAPEFAWTRTRVLAQREASAEEASAFAGAVVQREESAQAAPAFERARVLAPREASSAVERARVVAPHDESAQESSAFERARVVAPRDESARKASASSWTRWFNRFMAPRRGSPRNWLWAVPLAAALGLASVVVLREPPDGVRIKGGPFVSVVRQSDGAVDAPLSPGDVVTLSLKAAPYRYALVFATDAAGKVALLWPSRGTQSGDPAALVMPPTFIVTPGDFVLDAFFSDAPLPAEPGRAALAIRAAVCATRTQLSDCQFPAPLDGAAHHYRLAVPVSSGP